MMGMQYIELEARDLDGLLDLANPNQLYRLDILDNQNLPFLTGYLVNYFH